MSFKSKILNILIALAVAVTFIPVTGQFAFAEEEDPALVEEPVVESGAETPAEDPGTQTPAEDPGTQTPAAEPTVTAPTAAPVQTPSFDTKEKVRGIKVLSHTYNSVQIGWNAYPCAKGYELYRADKKSGKYKRIKTLTVCKYTDKSNKTLGKKKYYKVRAYSTKNGKKVYSKFSSILSAKPKLSAPKSVTTTGAAGAVTIKWSGVAGAKKYQVYRATSKNGKYKRIKKTKSKSYTDNAVADGKRYYYKVRAYRKVGKKKKYGSFSAPMEGMALLGNVANLKVTVNKTGDVTATWTAKTGALGYELQRALSGGKYVTVGKTTGLKKTDHLTASGNYVYRVRAYAKVNGKTQYGAYSAGGRANALNQARSWVGCKESNGSHKKIIDVFNNFEPDCGLIGYGTPWCAAFVSAVAISTGNTALIPVHSYCPTMLSRFANKTYDKKYTPQGADVVFFDWNWNKVPDHVGMVEKTDGDNITTIEGNYSDSVKRRTFKKGYSLLLAYGLPRYSINNTLTYKAPAMPEVTSQAVVDAACYEIAEALQDEEILTEEEAAPDAEPAEEATDAEPAEEATEEPEAAEEPEAESTELETAEEIIDYIQEEAPAADAEAPNESEYNAFLVYEVCDELDIDACVVTVTNQDGSESSYNEVVLDGELYILDTTEEGGVLEKYTPEEIN